MTITIASVTAAPFGLAPHPSATFSDGANAAVFFDGANLVYALSTTSHGATWGAKTTIIATPNLNGGQAHFDQCQPPGGDTLYGALLNWTGAAWQVTPYRLAYAAGAITVTVGTPFAVSNIAVAPANPDAGGTELSVSYDSDHTLYHVGVRTSPGLCLYALTTALATAFSLTTGGPTATNHNQPIVYAPSGGASGVLWQASDGNAGGFPLTVASISVSASAYGTWSGLTSVINTSATPTGIGAFLDTTQSPAQPGFTWSDGSGTYVALFTAGVWAATRVAATGDFGASAQCVGADLWVSYINGGLRLVRRVAGVWGASALVNSIGDRSGWTTVNQSTGVVVLIYVDSGNTTLTALPFSLAHALVAPINGAPFGLATHLSAVFADGTHAAVFYNGVSATLVYSTSADSGVTWATPATIASVNVNGGQIHGDLCQFGDTVYGAAMHWTGTLWQALPFKLAYAAGVVTVTVGTPFTVANFSPATTDPGAGGTEVSVSYDSDHTLTHLSVRTTTGLVLFALATTGALAVSFSKTTGGPTATSHNQPSVYIPSGGASGTLWQATDGNADGAPLTVNSVSVSASAYGTWSAATVVADTHATTTGISATVDTTGVVAQPLFAWSDGAGTYVATRLGAGAGGVWTVTRLVATSSDFGASVQCVGADLWLTFISGGLQLVRRVNGVWGTPTVVDARGDRSGWMTINQSTGALILIYGDTNGAAVYAATYLLSISGSGSDAPVSVTIGGVAVTLIAGTLTGDQAVAQRSQLAFVVEDPGGSFAFREGQPVILSDGTGAVLMRRWISDAQRARATQDTTLEHTITCVDNHYLADKRLAPTTYANQTAGFIFSDLITQFLAAEGVVAGSVATGPTIGSFISNYATVAQCFDALCQKAQGFTWWIDDQRRAYFVTANPVAAPMTITDALFERDSESVTHGNPQYRNTQYILGGMAQTASQTETRKGDSTTRAFTMSYDLATVPTITLNSVAQTVGLKGIDTGKQWYWSKGDPVIAQDTGGVVLLATDTLSVTYTGQYPVVTLANDAAGIATRQAREGGSTSGIVEAYASDTTLATATDAFQAAAGYLARYSQDTETLTFVTQTPGFAQGQLATVNVPAFQLNNEAMLIESVTLADVGPLGAEIGVLYYTVTCVKGPLNTSWVQFYAALSTQTQPFIDSINLGGNSLVNLLQQFTATLNLNANLTATVTACPLFPWTLPVTLC